VRLTKQRFGWPTDEPFYVPAEVRDFMQASGKTGASKQAEWKALLARYDQAHPDLAKDFQKALKGELPQGWDQDLPVLPLDKPMATRAASGSMLNTLAPRILNLVGGSADLTPSNNTLPKGEKFITRDDFSGRYIHFGVREHAMGGILNGLTLHGGLRPYGGTFLVFSDYMRPSIRLAALMELPVIYIFTHDSIGLGEDGPTHQPIEHLTSLRAIPNLIVFRPADGAETMEGWKVALRQKGGPMALVLTRQGLPVLDRNRYGPAEGAKRGGYTLKDIEDPEVILIGTGSEVHVALEAQKKLSEQKRRARVVSMPSWELFDRQPAEYKESVLPSRIEARVAVEAGATVAWRRYVGLKGEVVGLDRFGASAPYQTIYENLGITAKAVAEAAQRVLSKYRTQ
jgi:transketolase